MVTVPDFRGMDITKIEDELSSIGLELGLSWSEFNWVLEENTVIDQNPPIGTLVPEKTEIDFVYSQGIGESAHEIGLWISREVSITVPGRVKQEVVILVLDDFGTREVYREWNEGGERLVRVVHAWGIDAKIQVYIGGRLFLNQAFTK